MSKWPVPCEAEFKRLAKHDPARLVAWIDANVLSIADLTFAAEWLGAADTPDAEDVLLGLTKHYEAVVREGAVLGIGRCMVDDRDTDAMRARLHVMAREDSSPGVRATAEDMLG